MGMTTPYPVTRMLVKSSLEEALARQNIYSPVASKLQGETVIATVTGPNFPSRDADGVSQPTPEFDLGLLVSREQLTFYGVWVVLEHRRCGIGTQLVRAAEEMASRFGIKTAKVMAVPSTEEAHSFLLRVGYKKIGESDDYIKVLSPEAAKK